MNEKKLTETQKKVIFIGGISVGFLAAIVFALIFDPESRGTGFVKTVTLLSTLVGLIGAFLTQGKTKVTRVIAFCVGLSIVLSTVLFLSISDVGKLLGLYLGGFWAGSKWSKSDIVADMFDESKKDGH